MLFRSYKTLGNSVPDARYSVLHSGGVTDFKVNQRMGGGTWVYLGTFRFRAGADDSQAVVLSNESIKSKRQVFFYLKSLLSGKNFRAIMG